MGSDCDVIIEEVVPTEIYSLAPQSHVAISFVQPEYTADVDSLGTLRILEAIRNVYVASGSKIKLY